MATGRITGMFEKITTQGRPSKVDYKWLESLGYKSSNDRRLISLLKYLGFVDDSGIPSPIWTEFRGPRSRTVMGEAIRKGYRKLYERFEQAHEASNVDLAQFIRVDGDLGDEAATRAVTTFKAVASLADFNGATAPAASASNGSMPHANDESGTGAAMHELKRASRGVTLNVNLQLTLPESTDPAVYDALFASLQKHILSDDSGSD